MKKRGRPKGPAKTTGKKPTKAQAAKALRAELKRKTAPKGFDLHDLPAPPPVRFEGKRAILDATHWAIVDTMGRYGCTLTEIAKYIGIARRTLYAEHLKDEVQLRRDRGFAASKYVVRRTQFEHAQANIVGSIWWGKQHLRQADKRELSGLGGAPLFETGMPKLQDVLAKLARVREQGATPPPPGAGEATPPAALQGGGTPSGGGGEVLPTPPTPTPPPAPPGLPTPPPPARR